MRRTTDAFFFIVLFVSLIIFQMPAAADDAGQALPQATLPKALTPRLSVDGNTLYNGVSVRAVVADPNPSTLRRIPAPAGISDRAEAATAGFSITYIPNGGADAWGEQCYTFPEEAKISFDAAANIWANTLNSDVPITIEACWADLGSSSTLGYSGGGPLHRDFSGATQTNTWYSGSLANALNGSDLSPSQYDMHITYNRNFNWYYGTDGNPSSTQHDLVTVVLHEICHGLNFAGTMRYSSGIGSWGGGTSYPNIYDRFIRDGSGKQLISYTSGSTALGTALTSNDIWFHGSNAMAANGNSRVKMYAPPTWSSGSSYSHLDYTTFNNTSNQLMVYAVSAGESVHDPGVITKGLLKDLGWPGSSITTTTTSTSSSSSSSSSTSTTTTSTTNTTTVPGNLPNLRYWNAPNGSFKVSPQSGLNWGDDVTTFYGVGNFGAGDIPVGTRYRYRFYLSADSTISTSDYYWKGYYSDSGLAAGYGTYGNFTEALPGSPPLGFSSAETVYIGMIVDPLDEISESDETDNRNQGQGNDYSYITITAPPSCPDCSGETRVIENATFVSGTVCECVCTESLTLGSGIIIEAGATVTFKAPTVNLRSEFHAEEGAVVNIRQQ